MKQDRDKRIKIDVSDKMIKEAKDAKTIPAGEDMERSPEERQLHASSGLLGELAFCEFLDETDWIYEHQGGDSEPDFVMHTQDSGKVLIDTKTRIDPDNRDLIPKMDITFDYYILMYLVWDDDVDEYTNIDDVVGVEIYGFASHDTIKQHADVFKTNNSENLRPKKMLPRKFTDPLYEWGYNPSRTEITTKDRIDRILEENNFA